MNNLDTAVLHNILIELMVKYDRCRASELNKFLGIKNGNDIVKGRLEKISNSNYISYISKFIYAGLY